MKALKLNSWMTAAALAAISMASTAVAGAAPAAPPVPETYSYDVRDRKIELQALDGYIQVGLEKGVTWEQTGLKELKPFMTLSAQPTEFRVYKLGTGEAYFVNMVMTSRPHLFRMAFPAVQNKRHLAPSNPDRNLYIGDSIGLQFTDKVTTIEQVANFAEKYGLELKGEFENQVAHFEFKSGKLTLKRIFDTINAIEADGERDGTIQWVEPNVYQKIILF